MAQNSTLDTVYENYKFLHHVIRYVFTHMMDVIIQNYIYLIMVISTTIAEIYPPIANSSHKSNQLANRNRNIE